MFKKIWYLTCITGSFFLLCTVESLWYGSGLGCPILTFFSLQITSFRFKFFASFFASSFFSFQSWAFTFATTQPCDNDFRTKSWVVWSVRWCWMWCLCVVCVWWVVRGVCWEMWGMWCCVVYDVGFVVFDVRCLMYWYTVWGPLTAIVWYTWYVTAYCIAKIRDRHSWLFSDTRKLNNLVAIVYHPWLIIWSCPGIKDKILNMAWNITNIIE